jgi:hypothetical protein
MCGRPDVSRRQTFQILRDEVYSCKEIRVSHDVEPLRAVLDCGSMLKRSLSRDHRDRAITAGTVIHGQGCGLGSGRDAGRDRDRFGASRRHQRLPPTAHTSRAMLSNPLATTHQVPSAGTASHPATHTPTQRAHVRAPTQSALPAFLARRTWTARSRTPRRSRRSGRRPTAPRSLARPRVVARRTRTPRRPRPRPTTIR